MFSPKDLFLTKLKRIIAIPSYDGYLLCFGEEGDVYIINMFRMRLLKHSSIDLNGVHRVSLINADEHFIRFLITDCDGRITSWRVKTNKRGTVMQTICSDTECEINFEMSKLLYISDDDDSQFMLVYTASDNNADLLMVSENAVMVKQFANDVEDTHLVTKFGLQGKIIFACTVHKIEGVYVLLVTESYDVFIDRFDQLTEKSAAMIQTNLVEASVLNGNSVDSQRLIELISGRSFKYDDQHQMLYIVLHERK